MSLFDWVITIVLILVILWTWKRFSIYSPGSATGGGSKEEYEALQDLMLRISGENRQWARKYEQLEEDYRAMQTKLTEMEQRLERRTRALQACRELLTQQQGIEDSTP